MSINLFNFFVQALTHFTLLLVFTSSRYHLAFAISFYSHRVSQMLILIVGSSSRVGNTMNWHSVIGLPLCFSLLYIVRPLCLRYMFDKSWFADGGVMADAAIYCLPNFPTPRAIVSIRPIKTTRHTPVFRRSLDECTQCPIAHQQTLTNGSDEGVQPLQLPNCEYGRGSSQRSSCFTPSSGCRLQRKRQFRRYGQPTKSILYE